MKITLCGSAKFETEYHIWNEILTGLGHVVYSLAVFPSFKGNDKDWYDEFTKVKLDLAHLAKIEESDAILVINVDDYVGESTLKEILWARIRNKKVYFGQKSKYQRDDEVVFDISSRLNNVVDNAR